MKEDNQKFCNHFKLYCYERSCCLNPGFRTRTECGNRSYDQWPAKKVIHYKVELLHFEGKKVHHLKIK